MNDPAAPKPSIDSVVYVQDCTVNQKSQLYTLDLTTKQASLIGEIQSEIYDIAFVGSQLYGLQRVDKSTDLVTINRENGETKKIGDIGIYVTGLAYNLVNQTLYATSEKQLISINLETGKGTPILTIGDQKNNCAEIVFDTEGIGYLTLINSRRKKFLAQVNLDTNTVNVIGNTGFPNLASLDFVGNKLYGVTGDFFKLGKKGQIIELNLNTGKGRFIAKTNPLKSWAGMSTYLPVANTQTIETHQTTMEETMKTLTIDTKDNCYVINPDGMNNLQENVSNSLTLSQGTYEIKISGGFYSYAKNKTEGEPSVILWMYGVDGSTFVNQATDCEIGATWTTLHGYQDTLRIEVKNQVVICGLFFDINSGDNNGIIQLSVTSNTPDIAPQNLLVNSQSNCFVLDEKQLTSVREWNKNYIELSAGNYRLKIRESNATYWSEEQKFNLEPWALLWVKGGKFVSKLTGIETEESWIALNGLQDEFVIEVKNTTMISGFFFDTFKDDNEGQIILDIETLSNEQFVEICGCQPGQYASQTITIISVESSTTSFESSTTSVNMGVSSVSGGSREETVTVGVSGSSYNVSGGGSFTFKFDDSQLEETWKRIAGEVEKNVTVTDEQDANREAYYWDNLEKWILKGYQQQAKELSMKVARLEFMMTAFTQQMEGNFNQIFQGWSAHFDARLNELVNKRIAVVIEEQVTRRLTQQTQEITQRVVGQIQGEMEKRIEAALNLKLTQQTQEIKKLVVQQIQGDMTKAIETTVNVKITDQTPEINSAIIKQIQAEMDKRIDAVVTLKISDQVEPIKALVLKQIEAEFTKRIETVVTTNIEGQTEGIKALVIQQLQVDLDQRLEAVVNLKLTDQTDAIKNLVLTLVEADIDKRIQLVVEQFGTNNIDLVVNNVMGDVDNRVNVIFDNKFLNIREDVTSLVKTEINENYTTSLMELVFNGLKNEQFYLDMQVIKTEVENFYARLGQFETQLNLRITQGDTRLYNWTLEQLVALQGCLTDRQALVELFESFSNNLKNALDGAPCVQPTRFSAWTTTEMNPMIDTPEQPNLPEGE